LTARTPPGFDRLPRREPVDRTNGRTAASAATAVPSGGPPDADGRRALFSTAEQPPTIGTVTIACSACEERTVVSLLRAVRLAVPSLHLPGLRPAPWSLMRCPACRQLTWVSVSVRL
jgi:hypothetical protein